MSPDRSGINFAYRRTGFAIDDIRLGSERLAFPPMEIELRPITTPTGLELEKLLNDPRVTRHMPLHSGPMTAQACHEWALMKSRLWGSDNNLGPWAVYIDCRFAGWGGLQPEPGGEAGVALVLDSGHWGQGRTILAAMISRFRANGGTNPIVVQLAQSRSAHRAMARLGLVPDGHVIEGGKVFDRFLLRGFR